MVRVEIDDRSSDDSLRSIMEDVADQVRDAVGEVECEEHGEDTIVRINVESEDEIEIQVEGCCDAVVERVYALLPDIAGSAGEEWEQG